MDNMDVADNILSGILLISSLSVCAVVVNRQRMRRLQQRKKRVWVRPWISRRMRYGQFEQLMNELRNEDVAGFQNFLRVYPEVFDYLLEKVAPIIRKKNTNMRAAIPPDLRLALTLRFLASGDTYLSHQYSFRVAANTIGKIVPETCQAIYDVLKKKYFKCPTTTEEWEEVAKGFWNRWQFPNTIGALDGKHVVLRQPLNTGSTFYNYKGTFSIVLMALVDSEYRFLYVDVGTQGRISDGGVFGATSLRKAFESNSLNVPPPAPLPGDDRPMDYFMVADDAFPLRNYIMKPYPYRDLSYEHRVFNYRLSRARRIVENGFGILANRFRVLLKPILLSPDRAEVIVLACCALHNMLRDLYPLAVVGNTDVEDPHTHDVIPGAWRSAESMHNLQIMRGNNATNAAKAQRDYLSDYVHSNVGRVSWQDRVV